MQINRTMKKRGSPLGKTYPHRWASGPDPHLHEMYPYFVQQRNQANYRNESWELTFAQWADMWQPHWQQRGRERDDYCMTRLDPELDWTLDNTVVMTRKEHCQRHRQRQANGSYQFTSFRKNK